MEFEYTELQAHAIEIVMEIFEKKRVTQDCIHQNEVPFLKGFQKIIFAGRGPNSTIIKERIDQLIRQLAQSQASIETQDIYQIRLLLIEIIPFWASFKTFYQAGSDFDFWRLVSIDACYVLETFWLGKAKGGEELSIDEVWLVEFLLEHMYSFYYLYRNRKGPPKEKRSADSLLKQRVEPANSSTNLSVSSQMEYISSARQKFINFARSLFHFMPALPCKRNRDIPVEEKEGKEVVFPRMPIRLGLKNFTNAYRSEDNMGKVEIHPRKSYRLGRGLGSL